jgi:hypothetical protein
MNEELQIGSLVTIPEEMFMGKGREEDNKNALGYIRNIRQEQDFQDPPQSTGRMEYEVVWLDKWAQENEPEMIQWHNENWLELYKNK